MSLVNLYQRVHRLLPGTKQRLWSPAQQGGAHGGRWAGRGRATTHFWVRDLKYTLPGRSPCFSSQWPEVGTCPLLSALTGCLQKTHFTVFVFLLLSTGYSPNEEHIAALSFGGKLRLEG